MNNNVNNSDAVQGEEQSRLIIEKGDNGVVRMIMNRPKVGNAFNAELIDDMITALSVLATEDVRVLQLEGPVNTFRPEAILTG